jgi:aerobic carbon-monoxide dehydrogenase medium subunit
VFSAPGRAGYAKFRNPASRYAIVGVFVAERQGEVRVAVTGAGQSGVFRVPAMEAALGKKFDPSAVDGIRVDASDLVSDIHAQADYRAHLIGVMARRAVQTAA